MRFFEVLQDSPKTRESFVDAYSKLNGAVSTDFSVARNLKAKKTSVACEDLEVSGAIVETRNHPNLPRIIKQVGKKMHLPISVFHGSDNFDLVHSSVERAGLNGSVRFVNLGVGSLSGSQYNGLLMSETFWKSLVPSKKTLIFQTDSTICKRTMSALLEFTKFDYIGSYISQPRPIGLTIDGGNGGLSLRDTQLSISAIRVGDPELWPGAEDEFFATHIQALGGRVASEAEQDLFSVQSRFKGLAFGAHNPEGLSRHDFVRLFVRCPSVLMIHRGRIGRLLGIPR